MEHRLGGMGNLAGCLTASPSKPTLSVHITAEDRKAANPTVGLPHQPRRPTRSARATTLKLTKHPGHSQIVATATRPGRTHQLQLPNHRRRQRGPQRLDHPLLLHRRLALTVPRTVNAGDSTTSTRTITPPLPIQETLLRYSSF